MQQEGCKKTSPDCQAILVLHVCLGLAPHPGPKSPFTAGRAAGG